MDAEMFAGVLLGAGAVIALLGVAGLFVSGRYTDAVARARATFLALCVMMLGAVVGWGGVGILSGASMTGMLVAAATVILVGGVVYRREVTRSVHRREESK